MRAAQPKAGLRDNGADRPATGGRRRGDPVRVGPYRIVRRLGSGGMGTVYLAKDRRGSPVAVKLLHEHLRRDPQVRHRFGQEAAAAARVASFCTARVIAADPYAPHPFLVTEFVPGVSVYERVARYGPLPEADVAALAVGMAAALTAIHAAGVVHRDLKPSNVMLSPMGPKVIDFGIAGAVRDDTGEVGFGTPRWSAPEQLTGRPVGPPADVYAWGLLTAWAATGRHPFADGGQPDLAGLPAALGRVVMSCLAPDPGARPSSRQLLLALCGTTDPSRTAPLPVPGGAAAPAGVPSAAHGPHPGRPAGYAGREVAGPGGAGAGGPGLADGPGLSAGHGRGGRGRRNGAREVGPTLVAPGRRRGARTQARGSGSGSGPARTRRRRYRPGLLLILTAVLAAGVWFASGGRLPDGATSGAAPATGDGPAAGGGPATGGGPGTGGPATGGGRSTGGGPSTGGGSGNGGGAGSGGGSTGPGPGTRPRTVRDGMFEFTVTKLRCGLRELGQWPVRKQADGAFCVLDLRVSNIGKHTAVVFPGSQRLVDSAGAEYAADAWSWVYHPQSRPLAGTLDPGQSVTGALVFDVPPKTRPAKLVVHDTPLSDGTTMSLRKVPH